MAIEYEVFPDRALLRAQLKDTCDADSFRAYVQRRDRDPRFAPNFRRLIDARELIGEPSAAVIRSLTNDIANGNPAQAKVAFVAQQDATYGMFRMLENLSDLHGREHRAFRTIEEAEAWLIPERSTDAIDLEGTAQV
jgi:hypothetical protein